MLKIWLGNKNKKCRPPKWEKKEDGTYSCEWDKEGASIADGSYVNDYKESITVDKNSRVVIAQYMSW